MIPINGTYETWRRTADESLLQSHRRRASEIDQQAARQKKLLIATLIVLPAVMTLAFVIYAFTVFT